MDKINVTQISYESGINSRLEFKISGVNSTLVNIMRRVALSRIPIYAFNNITITENTSIFNNNYMELRIRNLPVLGIKETNPIFTKIKQEIIDEEQNDESYELSNKVEMNLDSTLNSSSLKQLTMYLDKTNNTDKIITIGTDDCMFYFAEKQIDSPYILPLSCNIQIIDLQPKQKIKLSAITELGVEEDSSIFSPVSIFVFKMIDDTTYNIILESKGQLDEKIILEYTIINIINILEEFLKLIPDNNSINGKLVLEDADHTIGSLIADGLNAHPNIKFAGYNMPHLLDMKVVFHYEMVKEENIKTIITDVVEKYKTTYNKINNMIKKNISIS
jgi:DNA-directed RNA polymerase subunit L